MSIISIGGAAGSSSSTSNVSGNTIRVDTSNVVRLNPMLTATGLSGGVQLASGAYRSFTVQAHPDNSGMIHLGGLTTNAPNSGAGFMLTAGNAMTFNVNNSNQVRAFATVSGDRVNVIGEDIT